MSEKQKTKNISIFLAMMLILLITVPLVAIPSKVQAESKPSVMVIHYQVSPEVLMPREIGTITVTIRNSGDVSVDIDKVHLVRRELESLSRTYDNLGMLGPGERTNITFTFKAPYKEGIYFPEIHIDVFNATNVRYPIPVNVNTRVSKVKQPSIEVEKTIPEYINPGDNFIVSLNLINKGQSKADDINLVVNLNNSFISSKSPSNYYIAGLGPGENSEIDLKFTSDKNADICLYSIPILLQYGGASGFLKHQTETIGVQMIGKAKLAIAQKKMNPDINKVGDSFTLTLKIENTGTDDAKGVKAYIDSDYFYGDKTAYLGEISKDDYANAIFTLTAGNIAGSHESELKIVYEDDYGAHELCNDLTLVIYPKQQDYFLIVIVVLLAMASIAIGFWKFKKR
jgi:hypothetical protein